MEVRTSDGRDGFGAQLRRYRIAAGLTQEALADRAGLSVRGIADLERGVRRFPHFHTLRRLVEALELSPPDRAALMFAGQRRPESTEPAASSTPWRCARCERENAPVARFCVGCGRPVELACSACGRMGDQADRFCHACGASLVTGAPAEPAPVQAEGQPVEPPLTVAEGEHKQATILFCQLADPGALAERLGQERMLAFLDRFFTQAHAEVARFEGTISSFLSDGFVALFGVPVAHEDHARRGVLAALELQRWLRADITDIDASSSGALRMALNTGLVAVGQIGSGSERRLSAVGTTITVAGVLQQHTRPGTIVIGDRTARMVTGYVRLEELEPVPVPGADAPAAPFRVTGVGPRRSPIEGLGARPLSEFVGRDLEISTLHDALAQVAVAPELTARHALSDFIGRVDELAALRGPLAKAEAGHGQVVGLVGEPGIGKSRLLYEFRRSLGDRPITHLEGRCLSYGGTIPYLPIIDLVRANCAIGEGDAPEAAAAKVRFGLQEVGLDPDRHAPYILHLLGLGGGPELERLSPEAIKTGIFETLRAWALQGSRRRPIIFAVEDLHWIDRTSEEYLASLAETLAGAPILMVCTWRSGYRPPWSEHSYATQLALRRLGPQDSLRVVRSVLQAHSVPEALARVILDRGEGNPFFLEELARAALDHTDVGAGTSVPDSIQGVLMARMDRLPDAPRRVVQTASVLGREAPLRLLEAIVPDPAALGGQLHELQRLEFLYERPGPEPGFVFKHALTQDVAYETLLAGRRRALHTAAGRALEALYADRLEEVYDRLAHHYSRTDEGVKAIEYLTLFAGRAARMHAHSDAARALEEALEHVDALPAAEQDRRTVDLAVTLAGSYYFLGRFADTIELLERHGERLEQLGDGRLAGRFFFELAHAHSHLGDYSQAVAWAERAIACAERAGDPETRGKAHYVLCKESMWVSRFPEGLEHGRRAVDHLQPTGERWWLGQSLCWQGINLYFMGDLNAALDCAAGGWAIGEQLGDRRLQSYAAWNRAWFSATRGDGQDAIAWGHRSIELSPDPLNNAFSLGWTGYAYLEDGDAERAIALLEQSIELLAGMSYSRLVGWFKGWLAEAHLLAGELERARAEAESGLRISAETGFTWAVGLAQRALGAIARAAGDQAKAERRLTEALGTFEATRSRFEAARTHLALADLADAQRRSASEAEHRRAADELLAELGLAADLAGERRLTARR
jgi:class 3 adenylate cyclase/tetratricopeptide (TPR) repeat protein/transcriptional regulator with XRE-family HTH domain